MAIHIKAAVAQLINHNPLAFQTLKLFRIQHSNTFNMKVREAVKVIFVFKESVLIKFCSSQFFVAAFVLALAASTQAQGWGNGWGNGGWDGAWDGGHKGGAPHISLTQGHITVGGGHGGAGGEGGWGGPGGPGGPGGNGGWGHGHGHASYVHPSSSLIKID